MLPVSQGEIQGLLSIKSFAELTPLSDSLQKFLMYSSLSLSLFRINIVINYTAKVIALQVPFCGKLC
jgi:hypothetical protein